MSMMAVSTRVKFLFAILIVFVADQLSKWWIVETVIKPHLYPLDHDVSAMPFLLWLGSAGPQLPFARLEVFPFFNIVMVWNKGISFGLFNQAGDYGPLILTLVSGAIALAFLVWLMRCSRLGTALALILIIGGAVGNIVDRLRFGAVVDFLDFHLFGWHWPAFNIADSAITIGIALLLIDSLFFEPKEKKAVSHDNAHA